MESHQVAPSSSSTNEFGKREAVAPPGPEPIAVAQRTGEDMKTMEARVKAELALKREEMRQAAKKNLAIESEANAIKKVADSLRDLSEKSAVHIPPGTQDIIQRQLADANQVILNLRASTATPTEAKNVVASLRKMEGLTKQAIRACSKFAA